VVGVTNPDPRLTGEDPADPQRSRADANPLTYFERQQLVRAVLADAGVPLDDFTVTPFPINFPELWPHYAPRDAVYYLTIYDDWGRRKLERFRQLGLTTEVLWERPPEQKGLRGSDVRARMARGEPWQHLVPPAVAELLLAWEVPARLRRALDGSAALP
jgi:nicotinamide-nucleotide adenylyltransferase